MKINSELPLCLLDVNNELNEYDFVLFHLYKSNKTYRDYFLNQRSTNPNRLMIFDNSAYEFYIKGEELNLNEYRLAIEELTPDYYILPDKLMDMEATIESTVEFLMNYKPMVCSKPLGVIQGDSEEELLICLDEYKKMEIDAVAVPFHNSFYLSYKKSEQIINDFIDTFETLTEDHQYAMGRIAFMMNNKNKFKEFDHVHILGSHCPLEKLYYKMFKTMDTGYPVKCGIAGYRMFCEPEKPNIIIDDFMDEGLDEKTRELIIRNVMRFGNI